jgi:hypothetical protein
MSNDAHERLLDMLHGWATLLDQVGAHEEAEQVADLYQKAGNLDIKNDDEGTDKLITDFMTNEVLPVILGKK